jgi:hypothetical protein
MLPQKPRKHGPSRADAEALATQAFRFLATEPERIMRFLSLSGIAAESVRRAASEPGFLPAVLDYFLNDEALLVAFAAQSGIEPQALAQARAVIEGPPSAARGPLET